MEEIKKCKVHGETNFTLDSQNRLRCKQCRVDAVKKRRYKIKLMSIEYKGGGCEKCGYNKCAGALEFHHINSDEKDFSIGMKGYTRSWELVKKELDKCMLLCANCHREIHEIDANSNPQDIDI